MKHKAFYTMQMERDGFNPKTDIEVELYVMLGQKDYKRLSQVGFNMAYAERELNKQPMHGSYQADMMHGQSLSENILYETLKRDGVNKNYIKGFLGALTEEACMEDIRQRTAYSRLEESIRDNTSMACSEEELQRWMSGEEL